MIAKRTAALLVAIVLIGVSIVVRSRVLDDNNAGATPSSATQRLTCVTELAAACDAIARTSNGHVRVTVEPAGTTADRLVNAVDATQAVSDGWLTVAPWPDIVAQRRAQANRSPLLGPTSSRLARSPLAIAIRNDRFRALKTACPKGVDWTCLGNQAGKPWGQLGGKVEWGVVRPAHPEPIKSATGLLVLGQAVGAFVATKDVPVEQVSRGDWQNNAAFAGWFQNLETNVPAEVFVSADPFAQWRQLGGITAAAVGGLEAEIGPGLQESGALRNEATVIYPAPVASADVVFAPLGPRGNDLMKIVSSRDAGVALARAGWRVEGQPRAAGIRATALPTSNGLPPAGTLIALQGEWQLVR
ncbi:MAG: hypothetical protein QOI55_603 [Actinomycetota bacterium]|nr:hypothetical protein [Actinomycetota bacterium]